MAFSHRVYLGLGSNLGDRAANLRYAVRRLPEFGVEVLAASPLYQTAPWGGVAQPDFLNQALLAATDLAPAELLAAVKRLEEAAGRLPTVFWGPRVLDIDILLYDELTFQSERLTIPHREMKNRAFVLAPLLDLSPELALPDGERAAACYARLPEAEKAGVRLYVERIGGKTHMEVIKTVAEMQELGRRWRAEGKKVGLVPTMGYLHEGHLALAKRSVAENDLTVMSVFVNPIQFGANEDLATYPRDLAGDVAKAASVGVDYVFAPEPADMYPEGFAASINLTGVTETLCGASRPGHFQGVCVVITKLFNLVQPTNAYFGQKDGQQLAVLKKLARDFNMPVKINGVPIVREADGLAKSSRNVYLDEECRKQALVLNQSLQAAKKLYDAGERDAEVIKAAVRAHIQTASLADIEYVEIVDALTMQPVSRPEGQVMLALAVRFKTTRLIDNILLGPDE